MARMVFDEVPVADKYEINPETKRKTLSAYGRLWNLVLESTQRGKAVEYEEYYSITERNEGVLCCRGSITD